MSILHTYIPSRVIDDNGLADGATLTFFLSGTNTLTPVYADAALTTPLTNPVVVPSGAEVPTIYLDDAIDYRRVVTYSDGSTEDIDPYKEPFGQEARQVRTDLASTDNGKGAALVALEGGGTIQQAISWATPEMFGAIGDGVADDTEAFQAACDAARNVRLGSSAKYLITADIDVPEQTQIVGAFKFTGYANTNIPRDYRLLVNQIILAPTASLNFNGPSAGVSGVVIRNTNVGLGPRQDGNYEADCNAILAAFAGTAIEAHTDNLTFSDLLILGFDTAINAFGAHRSAYERIGIDCNNGILQEEIFDISYMDTIHCWPFLTVAPDPTASSAIKMVRPGVAFKWTGITDINKASKCFAYGYETAFLFDDATDVSCVQCSADFPPGAANTTSIGFHNFGASRNTRLVECSASSMHRGFVQSSTDTLIMTACSSWVIRDAHIDHQGSGRLSVIAHHGSRFGGTGQVGYRAGSAVASANIIAPVWKDLSSAFSLNSAAVGKVNIASPDYESCGGIIWDTIRRRDASNGGIINLDDATQPWSLDVFSGAARMFCASSSDRTVEVANFGSGRAFLKVKSTVVCDGIVTAADDAAAGSAGVPVKGLYIKTSTGNVVVRQS